MFCFYIILKACLGSVFGIGATCNVTWQSFIEYNDIFCGCVHAYNFLAILTKNVWMGGGGGGGSKSELLFLPFCYCSALCIIALYWTVLYTYVSFQSRWFPAKMPPWESGICLLMSPLSHILPTPFETISIVSVCFLTLIHVIILWHGAMNIYFYLAVPWEPSLRLLYLWRQPHPCCLSPIKGFICVLCTPPRGLDAYRSMKKKISWWWVDVSIACAVHYW